MRDERVHKVFGLFLILFSFYLLVAFTSYLFTWRMDQDLMSRPWGEIFSPDVRVENWLGKLGALISHQFIFRWFGVAAFLFVLWAFIGGVRISLKTWLLPFGKTLRWSLMGLFWLPTLLGFFFPKGGWQVLGGGIGYAINNHLGAWLGTFGAGALILFAATAFFVYTFNPSLSWIAALFQRKPKEQAVAEEAMPEEPTARINRLRPEIEEQPSAEEPFQEEEPQPETEEELAEEGELEVEQETEEEVPAPIALDATATAPDLSGITEEANGFSVEAAVKEEALTEAQIDAKIKEFGEYDPTLDLSSYVPPTLDLLEEHSTGEITVTKEELEENKNKIVSTLNNYNIGIDKIKATIGPTVTLYEIVPQAGVRISKIKNLEDDIALSLAALGIRIIAPIPGKGTIGIEVPNSKPQVVSMRAVVASEKFQNSGADLPIVLGKTISNETFVTDLAKMPHLLMAGATGQGKSVGLNAILVSLLYKKHPSQIKFVLVDPKKVELTLFNKIERHFLAKLPGEGEPIITDTKKVVATLNSLCIEMDERYELLKDAGVRNLKEYNAKFVGRRLNPENGHRFLPYIVLVVDEFADLIMTAGREVETPIARLAQLARAIGIHLIIATQRPSVNIITGTIKANFPARIAFRVTSKVDSRTILDAGGADQLIGRGDMLLSTGNDLIRIQCAFVDTPEVEAITEFIGNQRGYPDALILPEVPTEEGEGGADLDLGERDSMFEEAARVVVQTQQGSTSLIQRKLKLGYNRAGRIVDQLEAAGILGAFEGSKARKVLVPTEAALDELLGQVQHGG
ncbi:MAG: DNA translocase FtsK 4TM domain-containing protein [Bacteroidetes bacterium]|nr:DNA translocase FtsK 4TM domain-containing protein [Bacteroidota bacterium]MBS1942337.1 DNA translocase FtsK 4TM domain-containing protein [Bacteroidota bacterium]